MSLARVSQFFFFFFFFLILSKNQLFGCTDFFSTFKNLLLISSLIFTISYLLVTLGFVVFINLSGSGIGCLRFFFLGPHMQHMEVPRLGVKSEL